MIARFDMHLILDAQRYAVDRLVHSIGRDAQRSWQTSLCGTGL
jgi:hypothetical protein